MEAELFSPYIVDILVGEGMRPESVLLTACCDRSLDDKFEDTYVFLCIDKVGFLTVEYDKQVSKVYNGFVLNLQNSQINYKFYWHLSKDSIIIIKSVL